MAKLFGRPLLVSLYLLAAACGPKAVDPDATFTVSGRLLDPAGSPAANTTVRIYKFDSILQVTDSLLHFPSIEDVDPAGVYPVTSDGSGHFHVELAGREVNTDGGAFAAFLSVVYFEGGSLDAQQATAYDFFHFDDQTPEVDVGDMKLWDGGSASQSGRVVNFSWASAQAPSGESADDERPYFLFAYDAGAANLTWGAHTFATNVNVPRAAFTGSQEPEYYLVGYAQETGGSRTYMHRTSLKNDVAGWVSSVFNVDHMDNAGAKLLDGAGAAIVGQAATDGDLSTAYDFAGTATTSFHADLGQLRSVNEILLYNLGVVALSNARVKVQVSNQDASTLPSTWSDWSTQEGDQEFQNWIYMGYDALTTTSIRWVRVSVEPMAGGIAPYFDFLGEIKVVE